MKKVDEPSVSHQSQPSKKTYERPRIVFKEPLEVIAAACAPSPPGKSAGPCVAPSS